MSDPGIRLRIDLAYVGTDFFGWQIQPDRRTVQGDLAAGLERLLGRPCRPKGAGRTDTGVHALGQVAHATVDDEDEAARVIRALPGVMPPDIQIHRVCRAPNDFHAIASATARRYAYHLFCGRDIFRPHCWQVAEDLDRAAMDRAAAGLVTTADFSSFCKTSSLKDDGNVCAVSHCAFEWSDDSAIFHVRADRFLHHMVRNMVGTLVDIGRGRLKRTSEEILAARDRTCAGGMAPAAGLFLAEVFYPDEFTCKGESS